MEVWAYFIDFFLELPLWKASNRLCSGICFPGSGREQGWARRAVMRPCHLVGFAFLAGHLRGGLHGSEHSGVLMQRGRFLISFPKQF